MRYNKAVYFQTSTPETYNYATGDYDVGVLRETLQYAAVTDAKEETVRLLYGELRQNIFVIRLQGHYHAAFDSIRIDDKIYRVDYSRRLEHKHIFYVSEVQ